MDEEYKYPLCTDCKETTVEQYDFDGVDWKFYWKLHILKNTFDELMEMDLEDEQFELIVSTLKYYVNKGEKHG
jgi:hypothetical protein